MADNKQKEKIFARRFNKLKKSNKLKKPNRLKKKSGLLTKLGTGKVGRYGKAAMLTAGIMAPGGPSGVAAFKEGLDDTSQSNKINTEQRMEEQDMVAGRTTPSFENPSNPEMQNVNFSSSSVSIGDQAAIRRQLGQDRLQARNQNKQGEGIEEGASSDGQQDQKSIKGRWQKVVNARKHAKMKAGKLKVEGAAKAEAKKMADKAVRKIWMAIHTAIEGIIIAWWPFLFITGILYWAILLGRPLAGMIGGNMLTITIKGMKVKLIPGYDKYDFVARGFNVSIITLITVLEILLLVIIVYVIYYQWSVVIDVLTWFDDFFG